MTQKLSPVAAREIWAVIARETSSERAPFPVLPTLLMSILKDLQGQIDEDPEEKPLGWWLDRDVDFNKQMAKAMDRVVDLAKDSTSSKEEFLEKGACAAIRYILTKGATLQVPLEVLNDDFNQKTIRAILRQVLNVGESQGVHIPTGEEFPKGSTLVIGADADGVSVGVAVPKGSLHEVEAQKETIN